METTDKKYKTFRELYDDYKDIIDTEFAKRHKFRLTQLKESIENREKWMKAHIMMSDGNKNQYFYDKAELLEEVYDIVDKELNLSLPYDSFIDQEIEKTKNKIVDELFMADIDKYRGKNDYYSVMKKASKLADIIEYTIKSFVYDKKAYNSVNINDIIDNCKKYNLHKENVLRMVHETIEKRDLIKMLSKINN